MFIAIRNVSTTHPTQKLTDKCSKLLLINNLKVDNQKNARKECQIESSLLLPKIYQEITKPQQKLLRKCDQNIENSGDTALLLKQTGLIKIVILIRKVNQIDRGYLPIKLRCYLRFGKFRCRINYSWDWAKKKIRLSGDVELNPGPLSPEDEVAHRPLLVDVDVITYNARGLKDKSKLKRMLNTCYNVLKENCNSFIMLQETHLDCADEDSIKLMWRQNFVSSPGTGRQRGVVTLFDKSWEIAYNESDNEGRVCIVIVKKYDQHLCLVNLYAPNNHDSAFFISTYERAQNALGNFLESKLIIGGDYNLVMDSVDSVNRGANAVEIASRRVIKSNNELMGLIDGYRAKHGRGGYTWSRGTCMSRLDMIFITEELENHGIKADVNWGFDVSDHASVKIRFKIKNPLRRGKGLYRVNTSPLDDKDSLEEVKNEITHQLSDIPDTWDPHKKLDFVKMVIRGVLSQFAGKIKHKTEVEQEAITNQLNYLTNIKEEMLTSGNIRVNINDLERDIAKLENELKYLLDAKAKYLQLRSGAKWYEEGEKSNKYFLNLIKFRGEQKLISELSDGRQIFSTQESIMEHVTNFYRELYEEKETNENYDDLLVDLPCLSDDDRRDLDKPITLDELEATLRSCKDSAPGPDGIPYIVYRSLWKTLGPYLLESWNYSKQIGILQESQRTSCITLLPKQGKDLSAIGNWRPITLTNCDLKIFTKLLADRVATKLDKLIIETQTAYVPGRVVHDNLRLFDFYKNYCQKHNIDGLLISLDAKKAFDSVSHKYLHEVLKRYGFSNEFIDTVKLLYNDIKANILVNGYKSVMIKIARSVKQGDALSCALFILCIDPLMRKIEKNENIKPIPIPRSRYSNIVINTKTGGFADDVGLVIRNDPESIKYVFEDYSLFSQMSGICLNVDKTEILKLKINSKNTRFVPERFEIENTTVYSSESIKICGIVFSNNEDKSYQANILEKITKLEQQLHKWLPRYLSTEGKLVIVKTFGLSQLIYSLQMNRIYESDIKKVESIIFWFLWNNKISGNPAPDRIKRSVLKKDYIEGGIKAPDILNLDCALKTKQFIRANLSTHTIKYVQQFLLELVGYFEMYKIEYSKICKYDPVVERYQTTTNTITDLLRNKVGLDQAESGDTVRQSQASIIASTDILEFLQRKRMPLVIYRFSELSNLGIETYKDLLNEFQFPRSDRIRQCARDVLTFFPNAWQNIVLNTVDVDPDITYSEHYFDKGWTLVSNHIIKVKGLRELLLERLPKFDLPYLNFDKFEIPLERVNDDKNPFLLLRKALHSTRDKFYKYRLLNGDIFCNSRMFKFKMVESQNCVLCDNSVETIKHLIWDCQRSKNVWDYLNNLLRPVVGQNYIRYDTIFLGGDDPIYAIETFIIWMLKKIISIDRTQLITNDFILAQLCRLLEFEKITFGYDSGKFKARWRGVDRIIQTQI